MNVPSALTFTAFTTNVTPNPVIAAGMLMIPAPFAGGCVRCPLKTTYRRHHARLQERFILVGASDRDIRQSPTLRKRVPRAGGAWRAIEL
jgi:hypothetical protein